MEEKQSINVGLLGLGTVGTGVYRLVEQYHDDLQQKTDADIRITKILVRQLNKLRSIYVDDALLTVEVDDVIKNPDIDVVIEVIGGVEQAYEWITAALLEGKHVITANKDLMAVHGAELMKLAQSNGCDLFFEASVAGGIPIIRSLVEGFSADRIQKMMGILNGTTNYMLSRMASEGVDYADCLRQAQELGYAEADPTSDVEGLDAARKVAILGTLGFHTNIMLDDVSVKGITGVTLEDIEYGKSFGYELKLLAIAENNGDEVLLSVQPTFIHRSHPLAHVNDVYNAVYVYGEAVGETMFYGPGAGELPTATAVVSDLVTVVKNLKNKVNGRGHVVPYRTKQLQSKHNTFNAYFIRLIVKDEPGVLAFITQSLADLEISISQIFQSQTEMNQAEIVIITHQVSQQSIESWFTNVKSLQQLDQVVSYYPVEGGDQK